MQKRIKNVLGPNIKFYRMKRGLTQEDMTARLNVLGLEIDRPMLSRIENQERILYDYEIREIAKILEIDYNDLFKDKSK